jgi:hypothetical protein
MHMLAAIGDHGNLGLTAVGDTHAEADELYKRAVQTLQSEARQALKLPA